MRQLNLSVEDFQCDLENHLQNRFSTVCTNLGRVDSKQLTEYLNNGYLYKFKLKDYNAIELMLLSLGSWFLDDHFAGILRADISQKVNNGSIDFKMRLEINPFLESKEHAINYLAVVHTRFSASDWYGNQLKKMITLLDNVVLLLFKPNKRGVKKYSGYCRGYKSSKPGKTIEKQVLKNEIFMDTWKELKQTDEIISQLHNNAMCFYLERDFENYNITLKTLKEFSEEREILLNYFGIKGSEAMKRLRDFEKRSKEIRKGQFLKL